MALTKKMTLGQMTDFIDKELIPQVQAEIGNWVRPRKKQGGYFIVTRQIFCMVDFLGAVYSGYPLSEKRRDPQGRSIAISSKSIKFITTFFEPRASYNRSVVSKLHSMYRNGLVHLYQPKILKLDTDKTLKWFIYRGKRHIAKIGVDSNLGKVYFRNVNHLEIITIDPDHKKYYLPTSIDCLYEDFLSALDKYKSKLKSNKRLQTNWRTAVNAIIEPR